MMSWLRLYDSILTDPKVQLLPPDLFKLWINLLCVAKANNGALPNLKSVAWKLRLPHTRLVVNVERLVTVALVDKASGDRYSMHDWDKWQYESDNSTDRVNDYRDRVRAAGMKVGGYTVHRKFLMERDGGRCVYCGSPEKLVIDHVVPVILGGDDHPDNLAMACKSCNAGKAGRTPELAYMSFVPHANYATVYVTNLSRLQLQSVTVNGSGIVTVKPSVSVSGSVDSSKKSFNTLPGEKNQKSPPSSQKAFDQLPGWEWFCSQYPPHRLNKHSDGRWWSDLVTSPEIEATIREKLPRFKASRQWQEDAIPNAGKWLLDVVKGGMEPGPAQVAKQLKKSLLQEYLSK